METTTEIGKQSKENFVRGNRVYILGPFDRSISEKVVPDLNDLIDAMKYSKEPVIEFYINSCGGASAELFSILALIDTAKKAGIRIVTYNIGYALSCGSMLAVYGDKKYMHRYAVNLPHLGQAFADPQTFEQLERSTKHIYKHFSTITDIYAKRTKMPKKMIEKVLKDDNYYMSAEECLKNGFCDEII